MKSNRKGFSILGAVMISVGLLIMALGFLQIVEFSRNSVNRNTDNLKLYWMAESASNYNVKWWVNQPTDVRKMFPSKYEVAGTSYEDTQGEKVYSTVFPKGENIAVSNILYTHISSQLEGNIEAENGDLEQGRYKLYNMRYKGSRLNFPDQAVWVLDSYAWDTKTGNIVNICLTNVYNYALQQELEPFINAELINSTLAGAGFHGVKGRFNEQDSRYGQCTFGGLVHFDYTTGAIKKGPKFYGLVKSYSKEQSWYKNDGNLINITHDYGMGLGLNGIIKDEASAIALGGTSLLKGYEKNAKPVDVDKIVWTWDNIVKHGEDYKIWFPTTSEIGSTVINVKMEVKLVEGQPRTFANVYAGTSTSPVKIIPIGDFAGAYKGIAVDKNFKYAGIEGISAHDFTLVTERAQVQVTNNFYLYEMKDAFKWLTYNHSSFTLAEPSESILKSLWGMMLQYNPKGHLAIASGLGMTSTDFDKNTPPIYFSKEQLYFTTTAYINKFGELNGKGTGNTTLKLFNIGPSMVLDQQEIMSGPSDTAQKWIKAFIQDQRYLRPDETLPPLCGSGPEDHPNEDMDGLNRNHRWSTVNFGSTTNPLEIIYK